MDMEFFLILAFLAVAILIGYRLLTPKNLPKTYQDNSPRHNIPDKFFEEIEPEVKKTTRKKTPSKKVDFYGDFKKSEIGKPFYAVFHYKFTERPSSYKLSHVEWELWPEIERLSYFVFDENTDFLFSKSLDFRNRKFKELEKYEEFLNDMRSVKVLVSHNIDFKIRGLKADFLRNGNKFSLFKRDEICLMENTSEIVGIKTKRGDFKWPSLEEMVAGLFFPEEDPKQYIFEGSEDLDKETRAMAKCFIKICD